MIQEEEEESPPMDKLRPLKFDRFSPPFFHKEKEFETESQRFLNFKKLPAGCICYALKLCISSVIIGRKKRKEKRLLHPSNLCLDVSSSLIEEE